MDIVSGLALLKVPTESVALSVIANGLTALLSRFGRKDQAQIAKMTQILRATLTDDADLQNILKAAQEQNANETAGQTFDSSNIRTFLLSPEVGSIVRQFYATEFVTAHEDQQLLRTDFDRAFEHFVTPLTPATERVCNMLFETLRSGCNRALAAAINRGVLSAHEAASAVRHRIVKDELAAIRRNLSALSGAGRPTLEDVLKFELAYRDAVQYRHGYVVPPHLDSARKVPIDDLYVAPTLLQVAKKRESPERLNAEQFLGITYRSVLLGDPGGGKSTFASKLAHHLCVQYDRAPFGGRQITPIIVVLRDYGADKKQTKCSILQFIETTAGSTYQVSPPAGAVEYLLLSGRAFVIFDGLDELLETSYRREISDDVESFCNRYPAVPVLVTSRVVGYEQAPLEKSRFGIFRLIGFSEEQVSEYAKKWFCADQDLSRSQSLQMAEAFIEESRSVHDLRSNPLMLGLMCNIYRGESFIPRNRPAVYEKCALLLFERWDSRRRISVAFTFEDQLGPVMKFLAHWIYCDEGLQSGVTEEALVRKATDYLCEWRFESVELAERVAREFIEFSRGRAWVFTDTGTTADGEKLYQFTHRTFLEYFTAAYLVRVHPTAEDLGKVLHPRIEKREWDVVAQLAVQLLNKNVQGAGEALIRGFLKQGAPSSPHVTYLSFAARCLEFVLPKPEIVREVVGACLKRSMPSSASSELGYYPGGFIGELLYAAKENREVIAETLERSLVEATNSSSPKRAAAAFDILCMLPHFTAYVRGDRPPSAELYNYWTGVADRILNITSLRMRAVAERDQAVCSEAVQRGLVTIPEMVSWHGDASIFIQTRTHIHTPYRALGSIVSVLLYNAQLAWTGAYVSGQKHRVEVSLANLGALGEHLLARPVPWFRSKKEVRPSDDWLFRWEFRHLKDRINQAERIAFSQDAMFGVFGCYAVLFEGLLAPKTLPSLHRWVILNDQPCFEQLRFFFLSRVTAQFSREEVESESRNLGLSEMHRSFVVQWSLGDVTVVGRPRRLIVDEGQTELDLPLASISDLANELAHSEDDPLVD